MKFETTLVRNIGYPCLIAREMPISASQYDTASAQQTEVVDRQIRVFAKFDLPYTRTSGGRRICSLLIRNGGGGRRKERKILFHEETFGRRYASHSSLSPPRNVSNSRVENPAETNSRKSSPGNGRLRSAHRLLQVFCARTLTPETL